MRRCYVYKLTPTAQQRAALERYLDVTRKVYNAALEQRIAAYRTEGHSPGWYRQKREIKELRAAGLTDGVHVHTLQDTLKRLGLAYAGFFRRVASAARSPGFPRFRSRRHWRSFSFQEWGNGVALDERARRLRVSGVGQVKIRLHRSLDGTPKMCTLIKKPDGWHAHIVCNVGEPPTPIDPKLALVEERIALDVGVETLARLSDGTTVENARHLARAARMLRREQRALARKRRGSRRREKQRDRVASGHQKVARARRDLHHKAALKLAERYRAIAVEDLTVTAMVRSAKGTIEQPGRHVRQKAGLNRSIHDAAWSQFLGILEAKLEERGGALVRVDPRGTSQECSRCHAHVPKALRERWHHCPRCGLSIHRDQNAAINIANRAWAAPIAEAA
jgi:putative transposase